MVPKKTKSKRRTLRLQNKIRHRIVEKNRKLRKEGKKMAKAGIKKRVPRDPGIPNDWPFKEELLLEAKKFKEDEERRKQEAKEKRREERSKKTREDNINKGATSISVSTIYTPESSINNLIDNSDVLIQALDARDPIGCRNIEIENLVIEKQKVLIYILTKVDLIPISNLNKWLDVLRPHIPVIIFKNSLRPPKHLVIRSMNALINTISIGDTNLLTCLKNLKAAEQLESLRVGVFGYRNTGRHSFIESMKKLAYKQDVNIEGNIYLQLEDNIFINENPFVCVDTTFSLPSYAVPKICYQLNEIRLPTVEHILNSLLNKNNRDNVSMEFRIPQFTTLDEFVRFVAEGRNMDLTKSSTKNLVLRQLLRNLYVNKICSYTLPYANMKDDIVTEYMASYVDNMKLKDLYIKEAEDIKQIPFPKSHFIIDDRYISGAWEADLKAEKRSITQIASSETKKKEHKKEKKNTEGEEEDSDTALLDDTDEEEEEEEMMNDEEDNEYDSEEEEEEEMMNDEDNEEDEGDNYSFKKDFKPKSRKH
ncbi:hypothetical protein WA158_006178 [Blastocystis sp. Blastoise]